VANLEVTGALDVYEINSADIQNGNYHTNNSKIVVLVLSEFCLLNTISYELIKQNNIPSHWKDVVTTAIYRIKDGEEGDVH
jgi:hypothetical protein